MAATKIPPAEILRNLLRYEPDTGSLFWLHRPLDMFPDARSGKIWNTRYAGKEAFTSTDRLGYRRGAALNVPLLAHRVIYKIVTGEDPDQIDHIDGDPSNNRWVNLRSVSSSENARNQRRCGRNTSGVTGVWWLERQRKWQVQGMANGARFHLGLYDSFDDAVAARRAAEVNYDYHPNHGRN